MPRWAFDCLGLTRALNTTVIPHSDTPCTTFTHCFVGRLLLRRRRKSERRTTDLPRPPQLSTTPRPSTTYPSYNISKPLPPLHLHQPVSPHLNLRHRPKFCVAHWHRDAILIWGALRAPQIPAATAGFARQSCEVVAGVDDLAAIAVEHQLLQRHRPPSRASRRWIASAPTADWGSTTPRAIPGRRRG